MKKIILGISAATLLLSACQKMNKPGLGDYPKDANPPGGPLKFYVAFNGTTTNVLMNGVDSVRANFPADNPFTSVDGISGKGVKGVNKTYIKFSKPNDWLETAQSATFSFWYKKNGQTTNNLGTNGPEYIMSLKSSSGHWSGSSLLLFVEGNNTSGQIKCMIADKTNADSWFTWEGGQSIAGLFDNTWKHVALVYNHTNSTMTLYVNGVANPNTKSWGTHGGLNLTSDKLTEMRIGCGPADNLNSDDWLGSTFKSELDQIRLYSSALTAAEVQALYAGKR